MILRLALVVRPRVSSCAGARRRRVGAVDGARSRPDGDLARMAQGAGGARRRARSRGGVNMTVTRMLRPLMRRWIQIRTLLVCAGLVTVAGVALVAQSGLAAIATTEADAREWVKQTVFDGGPTAHILFGEADVSHALEAFKKLPASARGPATTQLYAWTRAYVSTPAFNAEYVKYRETRKPQPP